MIKTEATEEQDEAAGFEHGILDYRDHESHHLSDENEVAWLAASPAYREGYDAGWVAAMPEINC